MSNMSSANARADEQQPQAGGGRRSKFTERTVGDALGTSDVDDWPTIRRTEAGSQQPAHICGGFVSQQHACAVAQRVRVDEPGQAAFRVRACKSRRNGMCASVER